MLLSTGIRFRAVLYDLLYGMVVEVGLIRKEASVGMQAGRYGSLERGGFYSKNE